MEIFLVFLLLIGAFNLGAATSDRSPADAPTDEPEQVSKAPIQHATSRRCRYGEDALIQRDLTVAHPAHGTSARLGDVDDRGCRAD